MLMKKVFILFIKYNIRIYVLFYFLLGSDCILHGYIKKLGGPFASAWQTRYAKLYPNRLELHPESATKTELVFLDQVIYLNQYTCYLPKKNI